MIILSRRIRIISIASALNTDELRFLGMQVPHSPHMIIIDQFIYKNFTNNSINENTINFMSIHVQITVKKLKIHHFTILTIIP